MKRVNWLGVLVVGLAGMGSAGAQPRFQWHKGQVLHYRVDQSTTVSEEVGDNKVSTSTKLHEIKRWQVLQVDAAGNATLQLSLKSLRLETTVPSGDTLVFDSAKPDDCSPGMKDMAKYVGVPLAVLRVDGLGKVLEVKKCKFGSPNRFESEPPFVVTLPPNGWASQWKRQYAVTLDPPYGTGEKFQAEQTYSSHSGARSLKPVIQLKTVLKTKPEAVADRIPLLQALTEGEVIFDVKHGRLHHAHLKIDQQLTGHEEEGSTYRFQSSYQETYQEE